MTSKGDRFSQENWGENWGGGGGESTREKAGVPRSRVLQTLQVYFSRIFIKSRL